MTEEEKCEHEWKQIGTKHDGAILELECVKCGEKKEIGLFPDSILSYLFMPW